MQQLGDGQSLAATNAWMQSLERKYPDVFEHSVRAAVLMHRTMETFGFSSADIDLGTAAAYLHDIGKLLVPSYIVCKPDSHTFEEREIMRSHVSFGAILLGPFHQDIADIVHAHHERIDGSGYPRRVHAAELSWLQRLLPVVDSFVAMTEDRPYQPTLSADEARKEIIKCAGSQFDDEFARSFVNMGIDLLDVEDLRRLDDRLSAFDIKADLTQWVARHPDALLRMNELASCTQDIRIA